MIERFPLNENLFYFINSFAGKSDFADMIFIFIAEYLIFIMILFWVVFFAQKIWEDKKVEWKEMVLYFSVPTIAFLVTHTIKYLLPTERPYVLENAVQLAKEFDPGSFPSGHTTLAFAMAMGLYFYNKKIGIIFFVAATLSAAGRVLVGLHFPLDVVAGMLLGVGIPLVFHKIIRYYKKEKENM